MWKQSKEAALYFFLLAVVTFIGMDYFSKMLTSPLTSVQMSDIKSD